MKKIKKFLSIILTVVMVLAMAAPAFAANITIEGGASGAEYAAYRLLEATDSTTNGRLRRS